jgi:hypothetical protein
MVLKMENSEINAIFPYNAPGKELNFSCVLPFVFIAGQIYEMPWLMNCVTIFYWFGAVCSALSIFIMVNSFTKYGHSFSYYKRFPNLYLDWSLPLSFKFCCELFLIQIPFLSLLFQTDYSITFCLLFFNIYCSIIYINIMKFSVNQMNIEYVEIMKTINKMARTL